MDNGLTKKEFRQYQTDLYRGLNRSRSNGKDSVMLLPTGSGKTAISRNHCSHILKNPEHFGIKSIIITTPQKQILNGFLKTNNEEWYIKGPHSSQKIEKFDIKQIDNNAMSDFLTGSSGESIAISCIQSLTNQNSNAFNPFKEIEDCSSILWVIDEAHHIEAEQTAGIISEFKKKNGKILYLTATPFTNSGALEILSYPDVEIIHRSLGEHMKDGFCPQIEMSYEIFDIDAGAQIKPEEVISDATKIKSWAKSIAESYKKDNKPKTLVVIPSFRPDDENDEDLDTINAAAILKSELELILEDIKIVSVVGNDTSGEISERIQKEGKTFPGNDIIIACRRFDEGTDVESLSAVYLIGMTGVRRIIQLMGRALRNKEGIVGFADKHPDYLNKSLFKFFIFNNEYLTDEEMDDAKFNFALSSIKIINAVQNFKSYDIISGAVRIRKNIQKRIEDAYEKPQTKETADEIELLESLVDEIEKPIIDLETSGISKDSLSVLAHSQLEHTNEQAMENATPVEQAYIQNTMLSKELETDEDVDGFTEMLIGKKRKKRNSNVFTEELKQIVYKYADEKVKYVELDFVKAFRSAINDTDLDFYSKMLNDTLDNEEKQLELAKQYVQFLRECGRFPSSHCNVSYEKKLGIWFVKTKGAFHGNNLSISYDSVVTYLQNEIHKDIFEKIDYLAIHLQTAEKYVQFVNTHSRKPKGRVKNIEEQSLTSWFNNIKFDMKKDENRHIEVRKFLIDNLGDDIFDNIDRESIAMDNAIKYVEFFTKNMVRPSKSSSNLEEKKLGTWFSLYKMTTKNGKSSSGNVHYDNVTNYLKNNFGDDVLEAIDYESVAMDNAIKYVEYISRTGKTPTITGNSEEKTLYNWFASTKVAFCGNSRRSSYDSVITYLQEHLGDNAFLTTEELHYKKAEEYVKFFKEYNKHPVNNSTSDNETYLYNWFNRQKLAFNSSKENINYYESVVKYLQKHFGDNVFSVLTFEEARHKKAREYVNFFKEYGRYPKQHSRDVIENVLSGWFSKIKDIVNKNPDGYESVVKYLQDELGEDIFKFRDLESIQLQQVMDIVTFIKTNKRNPSKESEDPDEKFLGQKLSALKAANKNNSTTKLYQKSLDYLSEEGMTNILNNRNLEETQLQQVIELVNFIKENNRNPNKESKDLIEKRLGQRLSVLKNAVNNKTSRRTLYPSSEQYLTEVGMLHILNSKNK